MSFTVATGFAFQTPPMSQIIGVSNKASFTVTTSGTNVFYQWQFNGTNIAGATNSSYTISNAPITASGNYTVVAVTGSQSITKGALALLTVLGPPDV